MNIKYNIKPVPTNHILSGSSLGNFFRILSDNRFRIHKRYRFRLFKSFLIILISVPNYLLEKLLFTSRIKRTKVKSPLFILGYPRSGTTHLIYLLSRDPRFAVCKTYQVIGPHVLFTFGRVLRFIALKTLPKSRPMDNMALGADLPKEEEFAIGNMGLESMANAIYFPTRFSEYFNRFVLFKGNATERESWKKNHLFFTKKLTLFNNGKTMLLKSPFDTGRIREILELYPDARFIHIYRNPFSVYSSNEKLYEGILPQAAFQEVANERMQEHILYTYKETYKRYFQEKTLIPSGNLYELSYEEFIGNELTHLEKIYNAFLPGKFQEVKKLYEQELIGYQSYQPNKHQKDPVKTQRVAEEWAFAIDAFGYAAAGNESAPGKS